jgi:tetratricopeptide (TPR) repeat protein
MSVLRACALAALVWAAPAAAQTPAELLDRARAAAREDRNRESADLFEAAVRADPGRRAEALREWADQLTYSDRAERAIPLYREVLESERDPQRLRWTRLGLALALSWSGHRREAQRTYEALIAADPRDTDARLGRARVLGWRDRPGAAREEYLRVLAYAPDALEAQRELARVEWWRGRPRAAQRRLTVLAAQHADDAETRLLLAEVQGALGRPDLARATVGELLARTPEHRRGLELQGDLRVRARPSTRVQQYGSEQSNHLDVRTTTAEHRLRPGGGRSDVELRYEHQSASPESGEAGVRVHRPGVHVRHRAGRDVEVNAAVHGELIRPEGAVPERNEVSYDAWVTLWPADVLRVDASSRRVVFDDLRSLRTGITGTYAGLSADFTPTEKARLTARGNVGRLSDGNSQRWGQVEGERRVLDHPRTWVGARFTAIDVARSTGHGYFEPQDFRATVATLRAYDRIGRRFWWDVEGAYGREDTRDGEPRPNWNAGARASYLVTRRTELEARYFYFSSLEGNTGGFARGSLRVGVRHAW